MATLTKRSQIRNLLRFHFGSETSCTFTKTGAKVLLPTFWRPEELAEVATKSLSSENDNGNRLEFRMITTTAYCWANSNKSSDTGSFTIVDLKMEAK